MNDQPLVHRHILLTAHNLASPPHRAILIEAWLEKLVEAVGMTLFLGPFAARCETMGNEGVTGIVAIETSHASLHVWDRIPEPYAMVDLYSCRPFSSAAAVDMLKVFRPAKITGEMFDRTNGRCDLMERIDWVAGMSAA